MFDISSIKSIKSNPLLAKSFIKYLSAYELMEAIKNGLKNGDVILNDENIINGILESDDEGKLLLLASGSKLDDFAQSNVFTKLYSKNEEMKSALFSNNQMDWYGLFIWNSQILDIILEDILKEDSKLKLPFYKNPRMDRRIISSIIKASDYDKSKHTYDFTKITFAERYTAAVNSLEIEEIKSEDYFGKDSPDDNEMYFNTPYDAVVVLIRDLFNAINIKEAHADYYITNLIYYIDKVDVDLDYDDWFTKDELLLYEERIPDFSNRYDVLYQDSLKKVIDFFDKNTMTFTTNDEVEEDRDLFRHYAKVCSVIAIIPKILSGYRYKSKIDDYLPSMIKSDNWVIRASAYSFIFQNLNVLKDKEVLSKLVDRYKDDKLALFWGISCSSHMVAVRMVSDEARYFLDNLFEELNLNKKLIKYFDDINDYIFSVRFRNLDTEILEKQLEYKLTYDSVKSIDKYLTFQTDSADSITYQLGKTVGKFFK
jgi:hypothetical protein